MERRASQSATRLLMSVLLFRLRVAYVGVFLAKSGTHCEQGTLFLLACTLTHFGMIMRRFGRSNSQLQCPSFYQYILLCQSSVCVFANSSVCVFAN